MIKLVICPGHYESYRGVAKNGYVEYDEVIKIVDYLADKFDKTIYEIIVIKGKLLDKVNQINAINPNLAIEVHLGNTNSTKIDGSRAFFMLNREDSRKLAEKLVESCVRMLGTKNRGALIGWYKKITPTMIESGQVTIDWKAKIDLFLSKVSCPAAIIEPFYLSSQKDCDRFIKSDKHDFIADVIYDGILRYLSNPTVPNTSSLDDQYTTSLS